MEQLRLCPIDISVASCHLKDKLAVMGEDNAECGAEDTGATGKEELEKTVTKLTAELEGWKDRFAMSAGQRIVARRQLEEFGKQVKVLQEEAKDWKELATEREEGLSKVQEENKELNREMAEWKQKAFLAVEAEEESKRLTERLQGYVIELEESVEKWKIVAASAEEECKSLKRAGDELEDRKTRCEHGNAESKDSESVPLQVETGEVEKDNTPSIAVEKGQERDAIVDEERQELEKAVMELRLEVEAWKKSAACIAEDGRLVRLELEKKLKEEAKDAQELKIAMSELVELQVELKDWKVIASDAAEECSSLRVAFDDVMKGVQMELSQWKEKAETTCVELQFVKAELQRELEMKDERASKSGALEGELSSWKTRALESENLQRELQERRLELENALTASQVELQKWKQLPTAAAIDEVEVEEEEEEEVSKATIDECKLEKPQNKDMDLQLELHKWRSKAQDGDVLQLQLKTLLTETRSELQEWKQKAAAVSLATESLKEELDSVIEEGTLEKEELCNLVCELEADLCKWRSRAQEAEAQLRTLQSELRESKEKAAAVELTSKSLMEELEILIEQGIQEKQEYQETITALRNSLQIWKDKAKESESLQVQLKNALVDTHKELQDWKERVAAVALATQSLKGGMSWTTTKEHINKNNNHINNRVMMNEDLCSNSTDELYAEVCEWKARAQEGVSVQMQLERALLELEERADAATLDSHALKEELHCTIGESSSRIHQLCNSVTVLKAEVARWKDKAQCSTLLQLQLEDLLQQSQAELQDWKERVGAASPDIMDSLKNGLHQISLEDSSRSERKDLCKSSFQLRDGGLF